MTAAPPRTWRCSRTSVFSPARARYAALTRPLWPPPMMTASYRWPNPLLLHPPRGRRTDARRGTPLYRTPVAAASAFPPLPGPLDSVHSAAAYDGPTPPPRSPMPDHRTLLHQTADLPPTSSSGVDRRPSAGLLPTRSCSRRSAGRSRARRAPPTRSSRPGARRRPGHRRERRPPLLRVRDRRVTAEHGRGRLADDGLGPERLRLRDVAGRVGRRGGHGRLAARRVRPAGGLVGRLRQRGDHGDVHRPRGRAPPGPPAGRLGRRGRRTDRRAGDRRRARRRGPRDGPRLAPDGRAREPAAAPRRGRRAGPDATRPAARGPRRRRRSAGDRVGSRSATSTRARSTR